MGALDIIEIPGYSGLFTRRIVVEMWQRAGSPRINDAGRLYSQQLAARIAFENGTGSPADDPRRPDRYPLAHVRFGALDVVNSARSAMIAAGFEYPYDYEPWHGQLPNIYAYPLVESIPASAYASASPFDPISPLEDIMANPIINVVPKNGDPAESGTLWTGVSDGTFKRYEPPYDANIRGILAVAFFGGKPIPSLQLADFPAVQRIWRDMCGVAAPAPEAVTPPKG